MANLLTSYVTFVNVSASTTAAVPQVTSVNDEIQRKKQLVTNVIEPL